MEAVTDFIFLDFKITADGDYIYKMPGVRRKAMTNLESILKHRDITLPAKAHIVKATVFLVVMCGYES